jgi:hypothetical protein
VFNSILSASIGAVLQVAAKPKQPRRQRVANDQVKGLRHAVPVSEANDLNRLLDVLRCANFEAVQLRFEANFTVKNAKRGE